ncbi:MAG: phage tail protein [Eubacterium sp.]|nr:phage tail protein [Eubacterium sp.]
MALGGGTFTSQNKSLPGSYINFVSVARAQAIMGERGTVTMGMELNWGSDGVVELTEENLIKNSIETFGYAYDAVELSVFRDIFLNATKLILYRLNSGGSRAENTYAKAKCSGTRGNDIKIVIQVNVDEHEKFDVKTYLDTVLVDTQTVAAANELADNGLVVFKGDATLEETAGMQMTGGTNSEVTGKDHTAYLSAIEPYAFNAIGTMTEDTVTNRMYVAFTKRMRESVGAKFQCVVYGTAADHEGVVNVKNGKNVVPWILGAVGGCAVNKSCTNKKYDGEADVKCSYTQAELESAIKAGEFVLHQTGDDIRVLADINSLTTLSDEKGEIFQSNQSIRVMDQIANDIAVIFNTRYIGAIANNIPGRNALWLDIVKHHEELQKIGAIENFSESDVAVTEGDTKKSVVVTDTVTIVNAMEQLYMTVTVQ